MSVEEITADVIAKMTPVLKDELLKILLKMISDLTPNIIARSEEIIETHISKKYTKTTSALDQRILDNEINYFMDKNVKHMDEKLFERENNNYKHARCVNLLNLYTECMESEPLYIPRKFRKDNYHVKSDAERNVIKSLELKAFQSECEILRIHRDLFKQRMDFTDSEVKDFITNNDVSTDTKTWLSKRWEECINKDDEKVNKKWKKKLESTKTAFEKDKTEYGRKNLVKSTQNTQVFTNSNSQMDVCENNDPRTSSNRKEDQSKNTKSQSQLFQLNNNQHNLRSRSSISQTQN